MRVETPPMHTRCPRCQLEFDAIAAWVQCPRCGAPFAAAPVAPAAPVSVPSTQAVDPALLAQVMRASAPAAWAQPAAAYPAPYVRAQRPGFVADEDLAGRAVISVVLSVFALLGGCNPVGLAGVAAGVMAYAAANDHRVELARTRGRTARGLAWASCAITGVVWVVVVLSLFYEF